MPLVAHEDIAAFAVDKVNLPHVEAQACRAQVSGLRDRLKAKINEDPEYGLVKSLHAGSVAKRTALKNVNDLDLAVYVKSEVAPTQDRELVSWLADRLFAATTNMSRDQFEENEHCVTVHYSGSNLDVDVVPVLFEGDPNDVGYLVSKRTGRRMKTSVRQHLDFISARREKYGDDLLQLIRLTKWWKRQVTKRNPEFKFKSFMIELIWASLAQRGVPLSDYPTALEQFFRWVIAGGFDEQVYFLDFLPLHDLPDPLGVPIEVLDPVNFQNNVGLLYDGSSRASIESFATDAFDALSEARFATTKGRAVDCWQEILGPQFSG